MLERLLNKVLKYVEIAGIFFQAQLDKFREESVHSFKKAKEKSPSLPSKVPSSGIVSAVYSFISPDNFSVFRIYLVLSVFFVLGIFLSFIPILYPMYHFLAAVLFMSGILLVGVGCYFTKKVGVKISSYEPNFDLWAGFFFLGLLGIIANFIRIGIPLFDSALRAGFHNQLWSFSYIFYTIGMMALYVKNKDTQTFSLMFFLSFLIALLSGFRTDFIILLAPLIVYRYLKGDVKRGKAFYLVLFFLVFIIGIRYALLTFSALQPSLKEVLLSDILFGKVGLDFYVLSIFLKKGGVLGVGGGMISLGKFFFQQLHIPSLSFGAVGSDLIINMTRRFESSLVGPTYLDLGVPGVVVGMLLLGFLAELPRRIYRLISSDFFLALYSINVSVLLVWIQTGIVQYYLFFMFGGISLFCLGKITVKK